MFECGGVCKRSFKFMDTENITNYIFVDDKNLKGDIALVFGTWNAWKESVEKAAELYKDSLVPKIIVSGGANPVTGIIEGDLMAIELEKLGVLKKDILVENRSTNTLENVLFSKEIIDKQLGFKNINVVTAVVKNYHARRALMTLRKHLPKNIELKSAVYVSAYYNFTKENWHKTERGKEKVMEEVNKIKTYLAKGDLEEIDLK